MDGRTDLDRQLAERVDQFPDAAARLGVLYPDALRTASDPEQALLQASDLRWYLHSSRSKIAAAPTLHTGAAAEFADELRNPLFHIDGFDRVGRRAIEIGDALELAARQIDRHQRTAERIAQLIAQSDKEKDCQAAIRQSDKEKDCQAAIRIACLILFNAPPPSRTASPTSTATPPASTKPCAAAQTACAPPGAPSATRSTTSPSSNSPPTSSTPFATPPGKLQHDSIDPLRRAMTNTRHP